MTLVRRPIMVVAPLAVLVIVLALATNVLPLREIIAQRQAIAASESQLEELMSTNQALQRDVEALATPIEVERLARSELGYVRPGEQAFVVIEGDSPVTEGGGSGDDGAAQHARPTDTAQLAMVAGGDRSGGQGAGERGTLGRVWDFITGRDLAG